jgi:hypothetical protein
MATGVAWLWLLALSQAYGQAGTPDTPGFQTLVTLVLEGEVISSLTTFIFILGALMFYYLLYRSRLVPRWLSGWGLIATLPYLAAGFLVTFGLFGHMSTLDAVLRIPLGLQEMVLAVWLIVKGFKQ